MTRSAFCAQGLNESVSVSNGVPRLEIHHTPLLALPSDYLLARQGASRVPAQSPALHGDTRIGRLFEVVHRGLGAAEGL